MRPATIAEAPGSAGCAPSPFEEPGRTQWGSAFTGMGRRRVRWANVGGLTALAGAAALIATHGRGMPTPPSSPRPPAPDVQPLPRLGDIPRLVLPRPRRTPALRRGPIAINRGMRGEEREHPADARPSAPSSQSSPDGQPAAREPSAAPPEPSARAPEQPTTGEFTPDPGP